MKHRVSEGTGLRHQPLFWDHLLVFLAAGWGRGWTCSSSQRVCGGAGGERERKRREGGGERGRCQRGWAGNPGSRLPTSSMIKAEGTGQKVGDYLLCLVFPTTPHQDDVSKVFAAQPASASGMESVTQLQGLLLIVGFYFYFLLPSPHA